MTISRRIPTTRSIIAAIACTLGAVEAACAPGKPEDADPQQPNAAAYQNAVRDSVKALLAEFTDAMNKKDMDAVAKLYSTDSAFFWIENAGVRYQNVKDLRDALQSLMNVPEIEVKFYETHIDVLSPTIANVRTEFSQTFMTGTGKGDTYGGYMTITVVREADGWRMRNGHTSSRRPRP